jgi:hypothetical protein
MDTAEIEQLATRVMTDLGATALAGLPRGCAVWFCRKAGNESGHTLQGYCSNRLTSYEPPRSGSVSFS